MHLHSIFRLTVLNWKNSISTMHVLVHVSIQLLKSHCNRKIRLFQMFCNCFYRISSINNRVALVIDVDFFFFFCFLCTQSLCYLNRKKCKFTKHQWQMIFWCKLQRMERNKKFESQQKTMLILSFFYWNQMEIEILI